MTNKTIARSTHNPSKIISSKLDDLLEGTDMSELINGRQGGDQIKGNGGSDTLIGAGGDDRIEGGAGNDLLFDGEGADILKGSFGADIFVIDFRPEALLDGHDIILDFKLGEDKIFFHSHEEGDFGDIRENGNDLEFYVDHGDREVLAGVMLNVAKDDFYASDSLAFVEIA